MRLIITEKLIAGRRIAEILANAQVPQTSLANAPAFEFESAGMKQVVVPLQGHIVDVDFPKQYSYWLGTDLKRLLSAKIEYVGKEKRIISALIKAGKDASEVVVATDADREGESIGVEALAFVKSANPKITARRAYFSAITPADITAAFSKLAAVDYNLADSANCRREIDLAWGAVLTRFLSLVSGQLGKDFLSAGRVQTPTLSLIVGRESERAKFAVRKYWALNAVFEKDGKKFSAEHKKGRFWEKGEAEQALSRKSGKGLVAKVERARRKIKKPIPFNTTGFLRAAISLGFGAGQAMSTAESLYQAGYTSYPRTDNTVYPKNVDLIGVLREICKVPEFRPLAEKILSMPKLEPSRGKLAKDHPPIYPVSAAPRQKLSEREWKIYELIVRHFLATLSEDAETENLSVEIDLDREPYIARGQLIIKAGWKEFYPYSQLSEVILPELRKGDVVNLVSLDLLEKETQPPARYSQSTLIKLMEDNGLGTKSTRHEIIQKLYARRYVSGIKAIVPSKIAFSVIATLEKYAVRVTKPKMTTELENEMDEIVAGKKGKKEVVDDSTERLGSVLSELLMHRDEIGKELRAALQGDSIVGKCDKCGGALRKLKSRNNKWFLACSSYPKCTNTYPLPQKGSVVSAEKECPVCGKPMIKVFASHYRYEMCCDPACPSKKDWAKKKQEPKMQEPAGNN